MIKVFVAGATGMLGQKILEVLENEPETYKIVGLSGYNNKDLLHKLAEKFKVEKIWLKGIKKQKLIDFLIDPQVDLVFLAIPGKAALKPYQEVIKSGKNLAIAAKEALIRGGKKWIDLAKKNKCQLIFLDSEIVALKKLLDKESDIASLTITCSGGPLLGKTKEQIEKMDIPAVLAHPRWEMGKKISVESALWLNKGYEIIEAHLLFDFPLHKIKAVIHPESYVHALVTGKDGAIRAEIGKNEMKVVVKKALLGFFPLRNNKEEKFSLIDKKLNFFNPDKFPYLKQGIDLVLNAYKKGKIIEFMDKADQLIENYLAGKIKLTDIYKKLN